MPAQIAILDDDHVIRLTRYAISGPGEITEAWAREFFMPEDVDPARVLRSATACTKPTACRSSRWRRSSICARGAMRPC